jgi:hypothetical protein
MTVLTSSPYSLNVLDLIVAKVSSHNSRGWSTYSTPNTVGISAMTIPTQMTAPSRDSQTNEYQIVVTWNALVTPDNGNSAITSYNL